MEHVRKIKTNDEKRNVPANELRNHNGLEHWQSMNEYSYLCWTLKGKYIVAEFIKMYLYHVAVLEEEEEEEE